MLKAIGFIIMILGAMMADSPSLAIPAVVTGTGMLLITVGTRLEVRK